MKIILYLREIARKMKKILAALTLTFIATASLAQTGTWNGKLDVSGTTLSLVFHIGDSTATLDVPDQGAKQIPVSVKRSAFGSIELEVPSINASYKGLWIGKLITGTYTQNGMSFPLPLTPGAPVLRRPQTPVGPFAYVNADVSFSNGDAVLKGTLTMPENCSRETPVLLMVTGSGLQNRDEAVFGHKPFAVIADAFAKAGIATLRYDDRGFGESTGDVVSCTTEDLKNDALAGIGLLRGKFDHVGVLGHSEGGSIALMLAAEGKADFVISLAGMVASGSETLLDQNRRALQMAGMPESETNNYCRFLADAYEAVVNDMPLPSPDNYCLPAGLKQNASMLSASLKTPYMKYFLKMNVSDILGSVKCPVMALNGTKDIQVSCERNLSLLRQGLPGGYSESVTMTGSGSGSNFRSATAPTAETSSVSRSASVSAAETSSASRSATFADESSVNVVKAEIGLNHMFQHCRTGEMSEYKEIEETFSPDVLTEMTAWLRTLFAR